MNESTTGGWQRQYSPTASLAALGVHLERLDLFGAVRQRVCIAQKTVRHQPSDKLYDAFITLLAGGRGLVEINSRLRGDAALQSAFGRSACAEQSVVQDTLNACNAENVQQMEAAVCQIFRQQSQAVRHDYASYLLLDVDLTGLPCGPKAAFATKGYFAKQRGRRGRQLGRVLASPYQEVVVDQVFPGNTALALVFQGLMEATEQVLQLDADKRQRTILRMDAGGGTLKALNWALERGYHIHGKDFTLSRVRQLVGKVSQWQDDPRVTGRQVAWVTEPTDLYVRPVRRIAVRRPRRDGKYSVGVIVSSLSAGEVLAQSGGPPEPLASEQDKLLAHVYFYDQRGGGVETAIKSDKQGLGLTKRNKKRFEAQQMVVLLAQLAHNTLIWAKRWLAGSQPRLSPYGLARLVRDLLHVAGFVEHDAQRHVSRILLNQAAPAAAPLAAALQALLAPAHVDVILGQT